MKKKFFALLMALCMILSMGNMTAFAADGSMEDPYMFAYRGEAVEIEIPAATTYYYSFRSNLVGQTLVFSGSWDMQVQYGKFPTSPSTAGTIELALSAESSMFAIINTNTEEAITVTVDLKQQSSGTMDNPEILEGEYLYHEAQIEAGNMNGYFYQYKAPADGTLMIGLWAHDENYQDLGWMYVVNNLSTGKYGDAVWSYDELAMNPAEIEVSEGDVIEIIVNTYDPASYVNPAGIIEVSGAFIFPLGSVNNPISLDESVNTITVPVGTTYYTPAFGTTMKVTADAEYTVVFGGEEYDSVNGAVTIVIPASVEDIPNTDISEAEAALFQIVNAGEEFDATVEFVYPEGTNMNPEKIESGKFDTVFEEGAGEYFYEWKAPESGIVTVTVTSEGTWMYSLTNMNTYAQTEEHNSEEDVVVSSEKMSVSKDDVIRIKVKTYNEEAPWETPAGTVTVQVSMEEGLTLDAEASGEIITEIFEATENLEEDEQASVELNWYDVETGDATVTIIPSNVLAAAKGFDVTLMINMGLYSWVIDPSTIVENAAPVNLEVVLGGGNVAQSAIAGVAGNNDYETFSLTHDGEFGFTGHLVLPIPAEYAGKTAVLYWDNNGTLVKMGEYEVEAEEGAEYGAAVFAFEHASDYVLVVEGTAAAVTPTPTPTPTPDVPGTGDSTSTVLWLAILALGVAAIAGSVVMKKREF